MRGALLLGLVTLVALGGCASQTSVAPRSAPTPSQTPETLQAGNGESRAAPNPPPVHPLPFKGKLIEGDRSELPPSVAMSLDDSSRITFSYREELTHDEHHTPRMIAGFDPRSYFGVPTGEYGVTASATLTIADGDHVIGHYVAQTRLAESYNMYSQPTHRELEDRARAAIREEINSKLARDYHRLAASLAGTE